MKRTALALTLILTGLFSLAFLSCSIPTVNASYHISPEGHVSGTDKIYRDGDVYTFTDDIFMDIEVEKSNIIIDGAGFKLSKVAPSGNRGITFSSDVHDVTIKNLIIIGFGCGIMLSGSGHTVTGCTIIDCDNGILLKKAYNSIITDNKLVNTTIRFDDSINNCLRNNRLETSWLGSSWQNNYNDVDPSNTLDGKPIYYLVNQHDLVISPIHYPEIGCLTLIGCTGITIRDIVFSSQATHGGVIITHTSNSTVANNNFTDLWKGIRIYECSDITLSGNYILNNEIGIAVNAQGAPIHITRNHFENNEMGISLGGSASIIHHNNFINNAQHVIDERWHPISRAPPITYVWDDGSEGNFWSDHNATDADNDGIADTPYIINQWSNNIDQYPLMEPTRIEVRLPVEPEPTPSPEPTSTPTEETQPSERDMTSGAILAVTSIVVFLGLLFYLIKKR